VNSSVKKGKITETGTFQPPASRWGDWKIWVNIIFLFLTLEIAVYSIEQAHWITPQPSLTLVLLFSIAAARLLTASRIPGWLAHILAIIAGLLVTVWQGVIILPEGVSGINGLISIFRLWIQGAAAMIPGGKPALFGVFLALLTWLVGYLATWFVLRKGNAWVAVLLGMVVIIVNLSNLPGKNYLFSALFLVAAAVLIIQTRIVRQPTLSGHNAGYSGRSLFYLITSLLCITVLAVSIAWVTPQLRVPALQNAIATGMPWKSRIQDSSFNILNEVHAKKSVTKAAKLQDLTFGKYWHAGEDIKYTVISPQPAYWQVNVYDTYNAANWQSSPATEELMGKKTKWEDTAANAGRDKVVYEVITGISTDIVLLTGDFASAEMPVMARLGVEDEITAARAPRVLSPGESYTVRTYVPDVPVSALAAAGSEYPEAIKAIYLQLPPDLPGDIKLLSENITAGAKTPYDKAVALDRYLSTFTYTLEVNLAPEGSDVVADFLFTQKQGFCLHFASAMTVMLRSVGVPARLAVGYLPGDPGEEKDEYLLRDKYYHAWTQVYFPGYGWFNFEPTPSGPGSQVSVESPLVSVPEIRQSPAWNVWFYPPGPPTDVPGNAPSKPPRVERPGTGRFLYAGELGRAVLIILIIAAAGGLLYGLWRVIRLLYSNWLWQVDREHLAVSAYANLCRLAAAGRLIPELPQTPLEFSAKVAEIIPEHAKDLENIVQAYLKDRFGPVKAKPGLYEEAEILKARILVYNALLRRLGVQQRILGRSSR